MERERVLGRPRDPSSAERGAGRPGAAGVVPAFVVAEPGSAGPASCRPPGWVRLRGQRASGVRLHCRVKYLSGPLNRASGAVGASTALCLQSTRRLTGSSLFVPLKWTARAPERCGHDPFASGASASPGWRSAPSPAGPAQPLPWAAGPLHSLHGPAGLGAPGRRCRGRCRALVPALRLGLRGRV